MRICIVGYGSMGKNHARVLTEMGHHVETVDPDPAAGATWLEADPLPDCHAFCIATPIDTLASFAASAVRKGPTLVEKPGALRLDTLAELHQTAHEHQHLLTVGYTERHNPVVAALKDNLHLVGAVRHVSIRRLGYASPKTDADPALDLATHDLDVLDYLGFDVELWHYSRSADHVTALLHGDSFAVSLEASHLHPNKMRDIEVVGTDGVLQVDYQNQTLGFIGHDRSLRTALRVEKAEPLRLEWEAFFDGQGCSGMSPLAVAERMTSTDALEQDRWAA
jgi:UDP-N-acetylglucosamine 3-dehydrogenase